jgi:hypothetical protein
LTSIQLAERAGRGDWGTISSFCSPTVRLMALGAVYTAIWELLIPELAVLSLDLAVQAIGLEVQLQPLLAKLKQRDRDRQAAQEADEKLEHERKC